RSLVTKVPLGGGAIRRAVTRVKPEQASKVTMRMPTLLPFGEGCTSGEVIDTRTRSIRRGSGHSTSEGWFVVIGGDPLRVRVAASTSLSVAATAVFWEGRWLVDAGCCAGRRGRCR